MTDVSLLSRRILALRLPRLATDRLHRRAAGASWLSIARSGDDGAREGAAPLAIFDRVGSAFRLEAVDARAAARGLAPGQPLADARARVPELVLAARDATGDAASLASVADWCDRWTPLVGIDDDFDGEAGLLLEIGGAAHLFGGEAALARQVVGSLRDQGFQAEVAVAGSIGAARAVARFGLADERRAGDGLSGDGWRVIAPGADRAALEPLPVAALDPDGERAARLARLGLGTIAALLALPRAALSRRFGRDLLDRLDEALGLTERPITPRRPVAMLTAERRFLEPIVSRDDVGAVLHSLAVSLAEGLERRGEGLRVAELALWRVDGTVQRVTIGTGRPTRDPDLVLSLFTERLKGEASVIEVGFGIDLVRLSVPEAARDDPSQIDLSGDGRSRLEFEHLLDRLGARLGAGRITRSLPGDGHLPEAAAIPVAARAAEGRAAAWTWGLAGSAADEPPTRPLRLLGRPEPIDTVAALADGPPARFRWRRALYEVERAEGPERIAGAWWRLPFGLGPEGGEADDAAEAEEVGLEGDVVPRLDPAAATRDYFRVEDVSGRRFWIFRAGLFGRETLRPRWFLHGIFA